MYFQKYSELRDGLVNFISLALVCPELRKFADIVHLFYSITSSEFCDY